MSDMQMLFQQVDSLTSEERALILLCVIERMRALGLKEPASPHIGLLHVRLSEVWNSNDLNEKLPT